MAALATALVIGGGSAALAAPGGNTKPGKLARLTLSPATSTIAPGGTQSYTAEGFDASGHSLGDLAPQARFTITGGGSCTGNVCTATTVGPHTVTATIKKVSGTATLTVDVADVAISQTVSNAEPFYYAPITFTTTVTNTSTTTTSTGVTAAVSVPAGLFSPTVTTNTGSYDATSGTWTIGALAPGATATLTLAADAAAVDAGAQTVTATVSATTFDPNSANNSASASETSQWPPITATISPGTGTVVDACAQPPDVTTTTFTASVANAANPDAPFSSVGNVFYNWTCTASTAVACPGPVGGPASSPSVTYDNNGFVPGVTYTITLNVTPDNMSQYRMVVTTGSTLVATCIV